MTVPLIARIGGLVLATTAFYTYVGQMVPQNEVHPPQELELGSTMTTADMVKVGREIMQGKGLCLTCHTVGQGGALRFPDLEGIGARAGSRVPGLSDIEYLAQSMYEPNAYVVEGFPPAMPPVHEPPIGLTDQEILCVIAALQTFGGTPTVTMQTTHKYLGGGGSSAPAASPGGAHLGPAVPAPDVAAANGAAAVPVLPPVAAHQTAARLDGARAR